MLLDFGGVLADFVVFLKLIEAWITKEGFRGQFGVELATGEGF
jgi:hypothetical protein